MFKQISLTYLSMGRSARNGYPGPDRYPGTRG